ncbi:erythromycin biosynthesis sensory transduction protein eryC1 [Niastella vici]|uniref:Erythromycin biosynthesis sensory transduction protein eryC1 n=1 Tax=Niastella vici TaxID=1703345 RepID=A0A1V9G8T2_9BACT|nr:DegT/DnrJ/EryC1/StrS family aminotransferase [Niastella vici]OQP66888.1 erythromycin biosynthesis sensory transduction protein eryC1 [Niastella vici]
MNIPFVDLKTQYQSIRQQIDTAIQQVITETAFIGGNHVKTFEQNFITKYNVKHCIGCANGTDAIYILLKMLGVGPGDEVITTACSWISTSETIGQTGAIPVFVDIEPNYYTIDVDRIEEKITSRTKAIIPVHLYGQMVDIEAITRLCEKHGLYLIEDCAQSHFSQYKERNAGTWGIAGTLSFYPGKNLGAYGDAGAIITNDDKLAEKCRMYANHGALVKHQHQIEGINSRLDGLQAAILNAKLPYIGQWTEQRIANAAVYDEYLKNIPSIKTPKVRNGSRHTFHLYVVLAERRNELAAFLKQKGIETAIHYPTPLPFLPAYKHLSGTPQDFPIAARYQNQILSLPMYPELTKEAIQYVSQCVAEFYQK